MKLIQAEDCRQLNKMKHRIISIGVLVLSISLIISGIFAGEAESVIEKATRICMECIGIG